MILFSYLALMVLISVLATSVVPITQIIYFKFFFKEKHKKIYLFSEELCNYDMKNLKIESCKGKVLNRSDIAKLNRKEDAFRLP